MLYRSVGQDLIVEKQWRDGKVLGRVAKELQTHLRVHPSDITVTRTRTWSGIRRKGITVRFPTKEAALAAETWIEKEFEF
jgi:hypothetical protein